MTINPITISYQVARHRVVGKRFHDLLRRPTGGWVFCNVEMDNTATVMREDDENIQDAELYGCRSPKSHRHLNQNETSEVTARMCWAFRRFQFGWR
jgi:hypothetical protein